MDEGTRMAVLRANLLKAADEAVLRWSPSFFFLLPPLCFPNTPPQSYPPPCPTQRASEIFVKRREVPQHCESAAESSEIILHRERRHRMRLAETW
jgi:hypothetical protein